MSRFLKIFGLFIFIACVILFIHYSLHIYDENEIDIRWSKELSLPFPYPQSDMKKNEYETLYFGIINTKLPRVKEADLFIKRKAIDFTNLEILDFPGYSISSETYLPANLIYNGVVNSVGLYHLRISPKDVANRWPEILSYYIKPGQSNEIKYLAINPSARLSACYSNTWHSVVNGYKFISSQTQSILLNHKILWLLIQTDMSLRSMIELLDSMKIYISGLVYKKTANHKNYFAILWVYQPKQSTKINNNINIINHILKRDLQAKAIICSHIPVSYRKIMIQMPLTSIKDSDFNKLEINNANGY